jgi:16S rRNA (guanine(527)-N(7))-methyltransferase RsmG
VSDVDRFGTWFQSTWPDAGDRLPALLNYAAALHEASRRVALVSTADRDRILDRHLRESLDPAFVGRLPEGAALLDVGSGGGLPAIPLGILRPDLELTLVEPREKKVRFLERMILSLGLHARTVAGRIEEVPLREGEGWSHVSSRALRWTLPMVQELEARTLPDAILLRFGPYPGPDGLETAPLGGEHGIQVWPRSRWKDLPDAH